MEIGAQWATFHGVTRVGHNLVTEPQQKWIEGVRVLLSTQVWHIVSINTQYPSDEWMNEWTNLKRGGHQDNHDGMITHLEPDILECEVKWALGSITTNKASGGDGIPVELFQIFQIEWCCESAALNMSANLENSAVATGLEKVSFHSNSKERQCQRMLKLLHYCTHLTCL